MATRKDTWNTAKTTITKMLKQSKDRGGFEQAYEHKIFENLANGIAAVSEQNKVLLSILKKIEKER